MLISCGIAEALFVTLSIAFNMPIPLLAIQLLWLNIVTDGFQDLTLSLEPSEKKIMREKPRDPKEPLFNKTLFEEIMLSGIFIGLVIYSLTILVLYLASALYHIENPTKKAKKIKRIDENK